ncbi:MAG: hypothetical protein ACKPKO_46570, partial [Candidatus Fonsibacter sp.]
EDVINASLRSRVRAVDAELISSMRSAHDIASCLSNLPGSDEVRRVVEAASISMALFLSK